MITYYSIRNNKNIFLIAYEKLVYKNIGDLVYTRSASYYLKSRTGLPFVRRLVIRNGCL